MRDDSEGVGELEPGVRLASRLVGRGRHFHAFPETRWSMVVQAGRPEGRAALAELCTAYWFPVFAFLRGRGLTPEAAREHTQSFFAVLLESNDLAKLAPEGQGRFRSWLRSAAKNHFCNQLAAERAKKRGGGIAHLSTDVEDAVQVSSQDQLDAEGLFNRAWARTIVERALRRLKVEYADSKHGALARQLLDDETTAVSDDELANDLNLTKLALRTRRCRLNVDLKKSFARCLRAEIAKTVARPGEIDTEFEALMDALS